MSGFATFLLPRVWCGPGDEVVEDDGIYFLICFGPEGIHWRGRAVRGMSCCA